ncbi:hypothetical protein FIV34_03285 [Luteibacter pinisoli]|uniref:Uncharacterized protein n=1 Tax=Luteibacter pinisoli TaxID=2589080 RepID=A0A4Y5Z1J9_9GAMM|nr:hypothetical protein [Luteibacter pinisoli]QDE38293.1 hypothetical protein FIV34_03285 [Luteibacter pinisoli]
MSKVRSFRAAYSERVARELFDVPGATYAVIAESLRADEEGRESFTVNGTTYGRVSPQRDAHPFRLFKKK